MTREEYLAELESDLVSLPKEERDMAVSFYSEYFDEAGPENEQAVIEDLGKPYALARSIIRCICGTFSWGTPTWTRFSSPLVVVLKRTATAVPATRECLTTTTNTRDKTSSRIILPPLLPNRKKAP